MKDKMAIIGDGDSILAFKAGGVEAFPVDSAKMAGEVLKTLAKEYRIIFITDVLAREIDNIVQRYSTLTYPIILPIPSEGGNGYGMEGLKHAMDKALGVDILFNNGKMDKED